MTLPAATVLAVPRLRREILAGQAVGRVHDVDHGGVRILRGQPVIENLHGGEKRYRHDGKPPIAMSRTRPIDDPMADFSPYRSLQSTRRKRFYTCACQTAKGWLQRRQLTSNERLDGIVAIRPVDARGRHGPVPRDPCDAPASRARADRTVCAKRLHRRRSRAKLALLGTLAATFFLFATKTWFPGGASQFMQYAEAIVHGTTLPPDVAARDAGYPLLIILSGYLSSHSFIPLLLIQAGFAILLPIAGL